MRAGVAAADGPDAMSEGDYSMPAELFVSRRGLKRGGLAYHRFDTASEAIDFVATKVNAQSFGDVVMTVGDKRFNLGALRLLHRAGRDRARSESA